MQELLTKASMTGTPTDALNFTLPYITIVSYVCKPSTQGNTHQPDGILLSQLGTQEE